MNTKVVGSALVCIMQPKYGPVQYNNCCVRMCSNEQTPIEDDLKALSHQF